MAKFMLLLHDDPSSFANISPEQMQKVIEKYIAWGGRLKKDGVWSASHKLTDEPGKVMRGNGANMRVTDGPYSETKEILGGYYLIEVESYERAMDHARDCPHLEYGGT
jgi:hypothetical protein